MGARRRWVRRIGRSGRLCMGWNERGGINHYCAIVRTRRNGGAFLVHGNVIHCSVVSLERFVKGGQGRKC